MDLSDIYSKTPKGLRARASLIGGLSSHLMKVLTHVDGSSKAESILLKFDKLTPKQLSADLARLEKEGYIRLATVASGTDDSWALTVNFEPMVVEEYQSQEELEALAQAQAAEEADQQAKQVEEHRLAAQLKADQKAQKLLEKEKTKAETKVKAQLEQEQLAQQAQEKQRQEIERMALEAAKKEAEAEAQLKAQQEAERIEQQQQAAERAAKLAEEARLKAELKAREVAEKAEAEAEAAAKENAKREIERISREAEEAQRKSDAEAKAKQESERLEALKLAKAAEEARQAALEAAAQAEHEAQLAKVAAEQKKRADAEAAAQAAELERLKQAEKIAEEARQAALNAQAEHEAQLEQAAKAAAEQERAEAEAAAQAAELERLKQIEKTTQEAALKEKLAREEKARLEIANVLRKAEEDRKNAVAQAKAEKLEAKRKAKAEQEAHALAERIAKEEAKELAKQQKLKAQAEEKAKVEAAQQAQIEAAQIEAARIEAETVREKALENERLEAKQAAALAAKTEDEQVQRLAKDSKVQIASEAVLAHLLAEEQANIATKKNAQLEMERIGREAEQARQKTAQQQKAAESPKTLPQQQPPAEAYFPEIENSDIDATLQDVEDFDAAEAAEEAAFEAEEQALQVKTHIRIDNTAKQATEEVDRATLRNGIEAKTEAMANALGKIQLFISVNKFKKWLRSLAKTAFIYVPLLVLIALALINFINLSGLIKPIEQLASESMGVPVNIKKVHASLWPQPHLILEDVTVDTENHIEAIHVQPDTASLFEKIKVVESLVIDGLSIEQTDFDHPLQWVSNISKAENLKVEQINLKNFTLAIRDLQLETFDGKVTLTDAGALNSIELVSNSNALSVTISPQGNDNVIVLKAANWLLPFNQKIMFTALNAKGLANHSGINFSQIEGEVFGGNLTGQANIQWTDGANPWQSSGAFKLSNANTEAVLNSFDSAVAIEGKLILDAQFTGNAREASKLASNTITEANFDVRQGSIKGIELTRGVLSSGKQSLAGDNTQFDKLTGNAKFNQNQYQFGKLVLVAPQLNANGFININANQMVTGKVNADLVAQSRRLKASFGITGRDRNLKSN